VAADPHGEALQGKAQSRSRGTDEAASEAALNSGFAATVIAVPTVAMMTSGRSFTGQPHQPTRLRHDALEFPDGETMLPTYLMEGQQPQSCSYQRLRWVLRLQRRNKRRWATALP
jgi:hypothetical protein